MTLINEQKLKRSIYRKSFFEFFKAFWHIVVAEDLKLNWHIEYLCNEVQKVAEWIFENRPKEYDLVINISPGSSKSTIISQLLEAWCWTRMPSFRFINGSYAYDLALKDSVACRDVVQSEEYQQLFPEVQLREDRNTMGLFVNTQKGGRLSVSVGSKVTGFHGHLLIVDDPIDPEQALSEADLKKVNRWMTNTLPSRGIMRAQTPMILVQQRLHEADPSGEALARMRKGAKVKHICIPAELIYNKDDTLAVTVSPIELVQNYRRDGTDYPNFVMDPIRLNGENLKSFRLILGEYGYAGQFLQDPVPLTGGMFDTTKIKLERAIPKFERLVRGWDKAATPGGGAYSCGVLMGVDRHGDYWVLNVVRGQWTPGDRERIIKQYAQLDAEGTFGRIAGVPENERTEVEIVIEKEGGSGGIESTENTIRNLEGFHATGKSVTGGDKPSRAYNYASQMALQDRVHIVVAPWTHDYIQEHKFFPFGKYKDQVDASSLAFNRLVKPVRIVGAGLLNRR